jgi:cytidylate kinase
MPLDIILIGPVMAGKSTLARLIAEQLELPSYSLDHLRWRYMKEIGYDQALEKEPVNLNFDFTTHFVRHRANYELAKHIVYTEGETPQESRAQILSVTGL